MNPFKKIFRPSTKTPGNPSAENNQGDESVSSEVRASAANEAPADQTSTPEAAAGPANDPNMVRVVDQDGTERFVPRDEWRETVLRPHLQAVWEDADQLFGTISQALAGGFLEDMLEPAEQLKKIDPNKERGAVILAIVYRELKRPEECEQVLRAHIAEHGESAVILVNLAVLHQRREEPEAALEVIERALQLDPNLPDAIQVFCSLHHEKGGADAVAAALKRLAETPQNWRALLVLAREELGQRNFDGAKKFYEEAFTRAGEPVPTDLLMQLTGDLGTAGLLVEMVTLVGPRFDVAVHGLPVAENLLRACLEVGRFEAVRGLLDLLYAQRKPEWRHRLDQWDAMLGRARAAANNTAEAAKKRTVAMVVDDGPVWIPTAELAGGLLPEPGAGAVSIAFLGATAKIAEGGSEQARRLGDAPGRFSRAFPLFLAEQVYFGGQARVRPMTPWAQGEAPAFVLLGDAWSAEEAARHARSIEPACTCVVVTHLEMAAEPWRAELRLLRAADAAVLGTATAEFDLMTVESALGGLAAELLQLLEQQVGLVRRDVPSVYTLPTGASFGLYLLHLEQLLAVRCNTMPGVPAGYVSGERGVIESALRLSIAEPTSLVPRVLLAQILRRLRPGRPQVVAEYREVVQRLQQEKPLAASAQAVVERLLAEAYA